MEAWASDRPVTRELGPDPEAHRRLREGSWHKLRTVVFTHLEGPLILSPNFPSRRVGPASCLFPSRHPFYDGEGWFSPNPADTLFPLPVPDPPALGSPVPASENVPAGRGPSATRSSIQMGPERGSGSPRVTRCVASSGLEGPSPRCPTTALGGRGRGRKQRFFSTFHTRKL